jgi:benzoyl-CoA reductase/2-hydroxyglutaryl-CoA dehydratase subunit BcrC/BadD/HgdB
MKKTELTAKKIKEKSIQNQQGIAGSESYEMISLNAPKKKKESKNGQTQEMKDFFKWNENVTQEELNSLSLEDILSRYRPLINQGVA